MLMFNLWFVWFVWFVDVNGICEFVGLWCIGGMLWIGVVVC